MLWEILWRNKNTFSLGFCLTFSLICIIWQSNPFAQGFGFLGNAVDRLSNIVNSGLAISDDLWVELDDYNELKEKLERAEQTIEQNRLEKDKLTLLEAENEKLREALGFALPTEYPEVRAEILGLRLHALSPRMIIGKGRDDGIQPFMPVLARCYDNQRNVIRCVVGVVVDVSSGSSIVQPLNHPRFQMGVRIEESGEWAMLSGNSNRPLQVVLTYLTTDLEPEQRKITSGQGTPMQATVYSSGSGGVFPPGIPVGFVVDNAPAIGEFRAAYVKPFADLPTLDYVSVYLKEAESWSRQWDREARLEEHLETEFGAPRYPDTPESRRREAQLRRQAEERARPQQNAADANGGQNETDPADNDEQQAQDATDERPGPRIINQNLPGQN